MDEDELYLKYLAKQIAITQNWLGRLEKKMWFLEQTFEREKQKFTFERAGKPIITQTDMFAG